ncbi:MAG: ribonuclease III [bacterium]|nr:ribonuclease III [bacterium]
MNKVEFYAQVEALLGYQFQNKTLILQAFTHKSFDSNGRKSEGNYERLEFFGDAVLKLAVSELLLNRYKELDEGELTKIRAYLISDNTLFKLAQSLGYDRFVRLSGTETRNGGATRKNTLADVFEAVLGALYLDGGERVAFEFVQPIVASFYDNTNHDELLHDYKSGIQEWLQKRQLPLPEYTIVGSSGPEHEKIFIVEVTLLLGKGNEKHFRGSGNNKKSAEQDAAKLAYLALQKD